MPQHRLLKKQAAPLAEASLFNEQLQEKVREQALSSSSLRAAPAHTTRFINSIASAAKQLASEFNLYASVMIAQASLESGWGQSDLAKAPNYNLFGIKGEYKGQSVLMNTLEWDPVKKEYYSIKAKFKRYPNYAASLRDNATHIRYGPSFDPVRYRGAWKENTTTYTDATLWLTGRYATDPLYNQKLNRTIVANHLTQFDYAQTNANNQTITHIKNVNKGMIVMPQSYYLYTEPFNTAGSFRTGQLKQLVTAKQRVQVTKYAITSQGVRTYYVDKLGWVDHRALVDYATLTTQTPLNKKMTVINTSYYLYNLPFGTDGAKRISQLKNNFSLMQQVDVEATARTNAGINVVKIKNKGWVDARALANIATIKTEKKLDKKMKVTNLNYYLYNSPYNTSGSKRLAKINSRYQLNAVVKITKQITTSDDVTVYYIDQVGWVDYRALSDFATLTQSVPLNKKMTVMNPNYYLYNLPFGTAGAARIKQIKQAFTRLDQVEVSGAATTSEGVQVIHIKNAGWVDQRALADLATITKKSPLNKKMIVTNNSYYLYNQPYNTPGSRRVGQVKQQFKDLTEVTVTAQATTNQGVSVYLIKDAGWVDHKALVDLATLTTTKTLNKTMIVARNWYYIYSQPYHTSGSYRLSQVKDKYKVNQRVFVTKEATTSEGVKTYYIKNVGWVDYRSLK